MTSNASRALVDLAAIHGAAELSLGQRFQIGHLATFFMQDYSYDTKKRYLAPYNSDCGTKKKHNTLEKVKDLGGR